MKSIYSAAFAFVLFFGIGSAASAQTIVDIATGDEFGPTFSTLVGFVDQADLVETLADEDASFTVFAPTNDAFAALPSYVTNALGNNPELLTDILLYHVVGEELFAEDVLSMKRIETVQGEKLRVNMRDGQPHVDDSQIIVTDVDASNGVIHAIDEVLIPNTVYRAVIKDIRVQVRDLLKQIRDVRQDQLHKIRG